MQFNVYLCVAGQTTWQRLVQIWLLRMPRILTNSMEKQCSTACARTVSQRKTVSFDAKWCIKLMFMTTRGPVEHWILYVTNVIVAWIAFFARIFVVSNYHSRLVRPSYETTARDYIYEFVACNSFFSRTSNYSCPALWQYSWSRIFQFYHQLFRIMQMKYVSFRFEIRRNKSE